MKNIWAFIRKHIIPLALIVLGILCFYWTKDYRRVPSGIGPAFFPRLIATCLIFLSALCILLNLRKPEKGEFTAKPGAGQKIALTTALLVAMVLIMEHVNPTLGIFLFLLGYLKLLAEESWKSSVLLSAIGAAALFGVVSALKIPL